MQSKIDALVEMGVTQEVAFALVNKIEEGIETVVNSYGRGVAKGLAELVQRGIIRRGDADRAMAIMKGHIEEALK